MHRLFLILSLLLLLPLSLRAQGEHGVADSLHADVAAPDPLLQPDVREYSGGFLLDMGLMGLSAPNPPRAYRIEIPDASRDYNALLHLHTDVTYSREPSSARFPLSPSPLYYSTYPWGGGFSATDNLQGARFRLRNGWQLHTYGQYDKDGWRIPDPSALPWERNNFKGAFELKSSNGAFGIRIEVQQGRRGPGYVPMGH